MLMNQVLKEDFQTISNYIVDKEKFYKSKWLITGSTGMIGSYLLAFLCWLNENELEKTMEITALHRGKIEISDLNLGSLLNEDFLDFQQLDLANEFRLEDKDNYDYVIHAASNASPKNYLNDPIGTINVNTRATQIMLEHFRTHPLKSFVYFSSGEIYGSPSIENIPTIEEYIGITDHLSPRSCYVESKKMGEVLCWNYFFRYNIPTKIIRPIHIFGPGFRLNDSRVWADFITCAGKGCDLEIMGDGLPRRGFCYIADAIVQIFAVIQLGEPGNAYNIGNENHVSVKELAEIVVAQSKNKIGVIIKNDLPDYLKGSPQVSCPSIAKVKILTGLMDTPLSEGIKKTMEWLAEVENNY